MAGELTEKEFSRVLIEIGENPGGVLEKQRIERSTIGSVELVWNLADVLRSLDHSTPLEILARVIDWIAECGNAGERGIEEIDKAEGEMVDAARRSVKAWENYRRKD